MGEQLTPAERDTGILVADDNQEILNMLNAALSGRKFRVFPATNGQRAVEVYQQEKDSIDVVLLDVEMPVMDGREALRSMKQINPEIRCCFMTGLGISIDEELILAGALCVVHKPFDSFLHLVNLLSQLVENGETES